MINFVTRCHQLTLLPVLSLLILSLGLTATLEAQHPLTDPFETGQFSWIASQPLITPFHHAGDHCYSVKDPSIVRYNGCWHLFSTIRSKNNSHQIEYRCFTNWKQANQVQPHLINLTGGYCCAPQVFYFSPQKKWYLIYQVQDETRKPSLQPAFSTTDDIADPNSWSKPTLLFATHPDVVKMWIDFWIICDSEKAHLFFTSHAGWMWRSETSLDQFPSGWCEPTVALRGDIFEASHTYRLKGQDRYVTLVEAQQGKQRYLKAYLSKQLDGRWEPLAARKAKPLASLRNVIFDGPRWTSSFSHPEFIRDGFDQELTIDPDNLKILFQGTEADTLVDKNYGKIPWKLGLLSPCQAPQ